MIYILYLFLFILNQLKLLASIILKFRMPFRNHNAKGI